MADDGKLRYDGATGKLMRDSATGKLIYKCYDAVAPTPPDCPYDPEAANTRLEWQEYAEFPDEWQDQYIILEPGAMTPAFCGWSETSGQANGAGVHRAGTYIASRILSGDNEVLYWSIYAHDIGFNPVYWDWSWEARKTAGLESVYGEYTVEPRPDSDSDISDIIRNVEVVEIT